jgi:murein L,D-transpeptidase YafK
MKVERSLLTGFFICVAAGLLALAVLYFSGIVGPPKAFAKNRVADARTNRGAAIEEMVEAAGLSYPPHRVFIRHFKMEQDLEVWGRDRGTDEFELIKTYPVCSPSGILGPKRKEGDLQVPEGVYRVDRFNPQSRFHLSMGVNYPNRSDRILSDKSRPGGEIFIHGDCVTIGCIPIEDAPIEELYIMALDSKNKSGLAPAVHVFPCRMDKEACKAELAKASADDRELKSFWENLEKIFTYFEKRKKLPEVNVDSSGGYLIES